MRYSLTPYIGRSAALVIALAPALAFAQQQAGAAAEPSAAKADEPNNVVIVTGVTRTTTKKNATFSINTLSAEDIQRLAPMSTADLLGNLPGIYAEGSTAGEASNNITVRGLPVVGGFRFAPQLIDGMKTLIARAHARHVKIYGATLTPYGGNGWPYHNAAGEKTREQVNAWIRGSGAFDGVVDFDKAVRDPAAPEKMLAAYDSGDHLHPNGAGYRAMAAAVDLGMFTGRP